MVLTVYERLVLLNILPGMNEGSRATYRVRDELMQDLSYSEEQLEKLQFKQGGETFTDDNGKEIVVKPGSVHWQRDGEIEEDIDIGPQKKKLLQKILKQLDIDEKLMPMQVPLYDKFMEEEEKE